MNRHALSAAAAILAALSTSTSSAQSVTLYGRLDVAVEAIRFSGGPGGSRTLKLLSNDGSRLGVRGSEDLGDGLRAIFNLESAVSPDTGTSGAAFWGRQAWVGLSSATWGDVTLGRNYSPIDDYAWSFDAFKYGGNAATYQAQKYTARINNSIKYVSPKFGGAEVRLLVGAPERPDGVGKTEAADISYFNGPFAGKASVQREKIAGTAPGTSATRTDSLFGLSYDAKIIKPSVAYFHRKDSNAEVYKTLFFGINVPVGDFGDLRANIGQITQGGVKARSYGLGSWYQMSKRTALYTAFARNTNDAGSNLSNFILPSYNGIGVGETANSLQAGIRHNF